MPPFFLCNKHDIIDNQAREFSVETAQGKLDLFVVRQEDQVRAYQNKCPHLEIPLNWQPDEFMSAEGTHIQCSTHGALFSLKEGYCVVGPCAGQNLTALALEQREDNELWLIL